MQTADQRLLYLDASALVKLVIDEPESAALSDYVGSETALVTSRLSVVEVSRATAIASSAPEVRLETERLLAACVLVDVSDRLLRTASDLASRELRALDAIHLASALRVEPDELVAYDRRLVAAAAQRGLAVSQPGT